MRINWKLRLKNKTTLLALIGAAVAFVYLALGILEITAPISKDAMIQLLALLVDVLVALGIVVDPTTDGIKDSARALRYDKPQKVTIPDKSFPVGGENAGDTEEEHEENDPPDADPPFPEV